MNLDTVREVEQQKSHPAPPVDQEQLMASLKELRRRYREDFAKAANFPKTASSGVSQISQFSRVQQEDDILELQFLRDERAAIREYDGGMTRSKDEYLSLLDVPCLPWKSTV